MRALARSIHRAHKADWSIDDAMAFADVLIEDRHLEAKSVGIEVVARYRRDVHAARCCRHGNGGCRRTIPPTGRRPTRSAASLIGPLLLQHPELGARMRVWATRPQHVGPARVDRRPDSARAARRVARSRSTRSRERLHADDEDLIQKAVGWALREAGKTDMPRLERYLRANGAAIPRTTLRYAIERFPERSVARC